MKITDCDGIFRLRDIDRHENSLRSHTFSFLPYPTFLTGYFILKFYIINKIYRNIRQHRDEHILEAQQEENRLSKGFTHDKKYNNNNYYQSKISTSKNVYIRSYWRSKFQVSSYPSNVKFRSRTGMDRCDSSSSLWLET